MENRTALIYIIAELVSLFFMWFAEKSKKKGKSRKRVILFLILAILPFATLFALRSSRVGTDYGVYSEAYTNSIEGTLSNRQEEWLPIGYQFITGSLGLIFGSNFYPVLAVITISAYLLFVLAIWRNSKNPTFSFALLMTFCIHLQLFNQFRQMLAIAITFFAYPYLRERKIVPYLIIIILASSIHPSMLIMLPVYFLANTKFDVKNILIYIASAALLFACFDILKDLLGGTYFGETYFGSQYDYSDVRSVINLLIRIGIFVMALTQYKRTVRRDSNNKKLYMIALFCTLMQLIVIKSFIFGRLPTVLFIYYILLLPEVYESAKTKIKEQGTRVVLLLFAIAMMIGYQIVYYNSQSGAVGSGYDEYTTIFEVEQ